MHQTLLEGLIPSFAEPPDWAGFPGPLFCPPGKEKARATARAFPNPVRRVQRFENWKLFRAFALPYFLRSTTRLSRVRKPAAFSAARRPGS